MSEADAILHVLQSAQHAPQPVARGMREDLVPLYRHDRGLVRVWAFDAFIRGAKMPEERADVAERIRQGLGDRFAAMRARAAHARSMSSPSNSRRPSASRLCSSQIGAFSTEW